MRLLIVHPGANHSVHDVFIGYTEALTRAGHAIYPYSLNGHLEVANRYLRQQQRFLRRTDPTIPATPDGEAIMLKASEGILLAALRARVDAVLIISVLYVHPQALLLLRAARMPVGLVYTESPYLEDEQKLYAGLASVCWTNDRASVPVLRALNARTYYLPAAYRAGFHEPGEPRPGTRAHDVLFIGTLFDERAELLAGVDWTGIDLGIYGNMPHWDKRGKVYKALAPHLMGGVMDNAEAINLYRAAKINLNPMRTSVFTDSGEHVYTGESANPRSYELAALDCFQLSGDRPEVRELFGSAVPIFRDSAELQSLIRSYLHLPNYRAMSVEAARPCMAGHSFDDRAAQLVQQLEGALLHNPYIAPMTYSGKAAAD